jgi:hypothetical protein
MYRVSSEISEFLFVCVISFLAACTQANESAAEWIPVGMCCGVTTTPATGTAGNPMPPQEEKLAARWPALL